MKLTQDSYFSPEASREYLSVSQFKSFLQCEAKAMAEINGEYKMPMTKALLVGSYVDAYFEGTLNQFTDEYPEIFKKDGKLKADFIQANEIIERIESDSLFMEFMNGEKQVIRTGELFGSKWKIKIDALHKDKIVDLKIMRSLEPVMGRSFVDYWMYDLQMAVYSAIEGTGLETYLAVATKEPVTDLAIVWIPEWRRKECLQLVERHIERIAALKSGVAEAERCSICDYCKQTKVLTSPIDFELVGRSNNEIKAMRGVI